MVNISFPTLPNCRIILSWSGCTGWDVPVPLAAGWVVVAAINWKFFTDATVTRPRKFRHQHCNCSCHLGDLFFKTNGLCLLSLSEFEIPAMSENLELLNSIEWSRDFEKEMLRNESSRGLGRSSGCPGTAPPGSMEEAGIACMMQFILRGPRVPSTFSSYEIWDML